jgi:glutamine---fructose-6-phosphate transaminase (isomerizing)
LNNLDPSQGYLHDILEQPAALEATRLGLEAEFDLGDLPARLARGEFQRIVLTGMGSSYHVQYPLFYMLAARGLPAVMIETGELIYHAPGLLAPHTLVVAVSQSGRSAEIVRLLDQVAGRGVTVLGVTNTSGSPLDQRSAARLLTHAGAEATVSCKTYVASLLALRWLAAGLTGAGLEDAPLESRLAAKAVQTYLDGWQESVAALEHELRGINHLFLAGRGASLAACGTGGLITKESAHVHAEGMSSAALRHGPLEMLGPDAFVLVFGGESSTRLLNAHLYDELRDSSLPAGWVDFAPQPGVFNLPPAPEALRPILEILPVEMATLALAHLRGHVPGAFTRASKVTTTE